MWCIKQIILARYLRALQRRGVNFLLKKMYFLEDLMVGVARQIAFYGKGGIGKSTTSHYDELEELLTEHGLMPTI